MNNKIALVALAVAAAGAQAADWSDTSLGYTTGSKFKEPFVASGADIAKNIISMTHVSGDKYGTNFFNAELLQSNSVDEKAQETYVVYRRMFDLEKTTSKKYAYGPVKNMGVTVGFDWNTKNDTGYGSRKRMWVAGPTFMMDVKQGFFNVSLLALNESQDPVAKQLSSRYTYKTHADLSFAWGVPVGIPNLSFEGYADIIAAKGKDEGGSDTAKETHFNGALMYDVSAPVGAAKNTFKIGGGYEYWHNKFGNPSTVAGSFARTPFVKAEYHF